MILSFVRPEQLGSRAAGRGFGFVCLTLGARSGLSAVPRLALKSLLRVLERRPLAPERAAAPSGPEPTPARRPRKRLRPLTRTAIAIRASWPTARAKSDSRTSGRSMPGDEISNRYAWDIGSSTSKTGDNPTLH